MYKVGFIDGYDDLIDDYKIRLKRKEIDLVFVDNCETKEDVLDWILDNNIHSMLVADKLTNKYSFNGLELVAYINSKLPDFPCIILSNYCEDVIKENLVVKNLFIEREILDKDLDSPEFKNFIETLKQSVEVFKNCAKKLVNEISECLDFEKENMKMEEFSIKLIKKFESITFNEIVEMYNDIIDVEDVNSLEWIKQWIFERYNFYDKDYDDTEIDYEGIQKYAIECFKEFEKEENK